MAEIKIRRKRRMQWWPILLVLLVPLVWYLLRVRDQRSDRAATGLVRDTGTVPRQVPLPPEAMPKPSDTMIPPLTAPAPDTAKHARKGVPASAGAATGATTGATKGATTGATKGATTKATTRGGRP